MDCVLDVAVEEGLKHLQIDWKFEVLAQHGKMAVEEEERTEPVKAEFWEEEEEDFPRFCLNFLRMWGKSEVAMVYSKVSW